MADKGSLHPRFHHHVVSLPGAHFLSSLVYSTLIMSYNPQTSIQWLGKLALQSGATLCAALPGEIIWDCDEEKGKKKGGSGGNAQSVSDLDWHQLGRPWMSPSARHRQRWCLAVVMLGRPRQDLRERRASGGS